MKKLIMYLTLFLLFSNTAICLNNQEVRNDREYSRQQILKSYIYEHQQRDYARPDWFLEARNKAVKQDQNKKKHSRMKFVEEFQTPSITAPRYELTQIPDALSLDDFLSSHPELTASTNLNSPDYVPDKNFRNKICEILGKPVGSEFTVEETVALGGHFTCADSNISDLKGIEHFPNIILLNCNNNMLTSFDITQNTRLLELFCNNNQLANLNIDNNPYLKMVYCVDNELMSLVVSNANVFYINCEGNSLVSMNISNAPSLKELICQNNDLISLNLSENTVLEKVYCFNNQLENLVLNNSIREINCRSNNLVNLDTTIATNIEILDCSYNQIHALNFSKNEKLLNIYCQVNEIENLLINNNPYLEEINCSPLCQDTLRQLFPVN